MCFWVPRATCAAAWLGAPGYGMSVDVRWDGRIVVIVESVEKNEGDNGDFEKPSEEYCG